jgi:kynureninase
MIDHMRRHAAEIAHCDWSDGGIDLLSGYFPYVELRGKIGRLINARYQEIALTQNATMGMNFLANGLDLPEGAEVLTTDKEHSGGRSGWQLRAKRYGTSWRQVPISVPVEDPEQIIDAFVRAIGPKTRVLSLPHITSGTGTILPVKEICRHAAEKGIFTIVDGAQAVGQIPVDVKDIGCDAYFARSGSTGYGPRWRPASGTTTRTTASGSQPGARATRPCWRAWTKPWISTSRWVPAASTAASRSWAIPSGPAWPPSPGPRS